MSQIPTSPRTAERKQEKVMLKDLNDRFEKVLNEVRVANFHLGKEADQLLFEANAQGAHHLLRIGQTDALKTRLTAEQRDIAKLLEEKHAKEKTVKDKDGEAGKVEDEGAARLAKIKAEIRDISAKVVDKELEIEDLRYKQKNMKHRHDQLEADIYNFNAKKHEFETATSTANKEHDELNHLINAVKADNARIEDALGQYKNEEYYTSFEKEFYRKLDLFESEQALHFETALEVERQRLHAEYNRKSLEIKPEKEREAEIADKLKLKQGLEEKLESLIKLISVLRFDTKQLKQAVDDKAKEIMRLLKDLYKTEFKEINEVSIVSNLGVLEKTLESEFLALDAEIHDETVKHAQNRSERQAELERLLELERQMVMNAQCDVPLTAELREYETMLKKMEGIGKAPVGIFQRVSSHGERGSIDPVAGPSHVSSPAATPEKPSVRNKGAAAAHSPELIPKSKSVAVGDKRKHMDTPRP